MDYGLFLDLSKEKETSGEGKAGEVGRSTENEPNINNHRLSPVICETR